MTAAIKLKAMVRLLLILSVGLAISSSLAATFENRNKISFMPVTSCVDPGFHFTVREFRGVVLDVNGNGVPHVKADLHRFREESDGGAALEPSPDVFTSFVTDEKGRFALPKLHNGIYLVLVHPPRLYLSERVVVKLDRKGASNGLIDRLGLKGNCQATWELSSDR